MKLLIIDDEPDFTDVLVERLREGEYEIDIAIARSLESARQALTDDTVDLVICDLKIPPLDGGLDAEVDHGQAAYSFAREQAPGTPVIVMSGFGTVSIVADVAANAPHGDPFGLGESQPMLSYVVKESDLSPCVSTVEKAAGAVASLGEINLHSWPQDLDLTNEEVRVLRLLAQLRDGAVIRVSELGGGLTEARVLKIRVERETGALAFVAVAKIAELSSIEDEVWRYGQYVSYLPADGITPLMTTIRAGAGRMAGAFYTLDERFVDSLFVVIGGGGPRVPRAVDGLRATTRRWREGCGNQRLRLADIRRSIVDDSTVEALEDELPDFERERIEDIEVLARPCTQHCDLHGGNALVDRDGRPVVIDYGSVGQSTAAIDPITLEASLFFHPGGLPLCEDWPNVDDVQRWEDVPSYCEGTTFEPFVEACRRWAVEESASPSEVWAAFYAIGVRALKYPDTDHDVARAVVELAAERLDKDAGS